MDDIPRAFAISDIQKEQIRWMCGISMKDRRTNEELRMLVGIESITTVIRSGRMRW